MHRAADRLPTSLLPRIKSVVMFGDPYQRLGGLSSQFPYSLRAKVLQLCADGDPVSVLSPLAVLLLHVLRTLAILTRTNQVCDSGSCQFYHLTYIRPEWISLAVDFIVRGFKE